MKEKRRDESSKGKTVREAAEDHWDWLYETMDRYADRSAEWDYDEMMAELRWMFIEAFIHGHKHGKEGKP